MRNTLSLTASIVLLSLVFVTGCGIKPVAKTQTPAGVAVANTPAEGMYRVTSEKGYSIDVLSDWTEHQNPGYGIDKMYMRPRAGDDASFGENINILVEALPYEMSASEYAAKGAEQLTKQMNATIISNASFMGVIPGNKHVFTLNMKNVDTKTASIVFVKNKTAYVITCTASPATYSQYESKFDQMARTLQVL